MAKKVLFVGDYKEFPAEGMEVVTKKFVDCYSEFGQSVETVQAKFFLKKFINIVFNRYQYVVFTHGPGNGAYMLTLLTSVFSRVKVVWIASRPNVRLNSVCDLFLFRLKRIYASKLNERLIDLASTCGAEFKKVIIGIDRARINKSLLDSAHSKFALYVNSLPLKNVPLVLHVGHLRKNRGLEKLVDLKSHLGDKVNVVVVASPSLDVDIEVIDMLEAAQVGIYKEYESNMANIYMLADVYVFPVDPIVGGAIDLPLSVVEALACGKRVVSTKFGALQEYLSDNSQVCLVDDEFIRVVSDLVLHNSYKVEVVDELPGEFDLAHLVKLVYEENI